MTEAAAPSSDARSASGDLEALASAYGIEGQYIDVRGRARETPEHTKRVLLGAMGVRAQTPQDVRAALDARAAAAWEIALPPAIVTGGAAAQVPVVLPCDAGEIHWRIELEAGTESVGMARDVVGTAAFDELRLIAETSRGGRRLQRRVLVVKDDLPLGYHRLRVDGLEGSVRFIVTPAACWLPPGFSRGDRMSGISVQLYLLRSAANWGIGDFTDLRKLTERVAARGGDVIGLNPLHQMFSDDPEKASPYSPASRLLLNVFAIDVEAIPELAASRAADGRLREPAFRSTLEACRAARFVDYSAAASLKLAVLRLIFEDFSRVSTPQRRAAFADFRAARPHLERTYVFTALREHFARRVQTQSRWQDWPAEYHDPASPAVARFARDNADDITFIAWLQWIADAQLEGAARAARPMRVGLYRDLAVGGDPAGAETWANQRAVVDAARIGAPPDIYNPPGQNWDLPPFDPHALRAEGYASFVELVRANMRHAGGLRIDHVMALQHLYWIPRGAEPNAGAYVRYPLDDLVGILALESHRARCLVVGEDLGTVPAGFRDRMNRANILSYRVFFFERDEQGSYAQPAQYPRAAVAVLGSHDLPTLAAWWSDADIDLRERLGLLVGAASAEARQQRAADRAALIAALRAAGVLDDRRRIDDDLLFRAAHTFLAATSAAFAIAQMDDVTAEIEPVNLPTTSDERPNWRRRYARTLEELDADERLGALFDIFRDTGRLRE